MVVIATIACDAVVAIVNDRSIAFVASLFALTALSTMLALLWTTPADAIVLPRGRSERLIGGVAIALYAIASIDASSRGFIVCAVAIATLSLGLFATRARSSSAWWIALVAWNPLVIQMIRA